MGFGNAAGSFMTGFMAGYKFIDDAVKKQQEIDALKQKGEIELANEKNKFIEGQNTLTRQLQLDFDKLDEEMNKELKEASSPEMNIAIRNKYDDKKAIRTFTYNDTIRNQYASVEKTPLSQFARPVIAYNSSKLFEVKAEDGTSFVVSNASDFGKKLQEDLKNPVNERRYIIDKSGYVLTKNVYGDKVAIDINGNTANDDVSAVRLKNINEIMTQKPEATNAYSLYPQNMITPELRDKLISVGIKPDKNGDFTGLTWGTVESANKVSMGAYTFEAKAMYSKDGKTIISVTNTDEYNKALAKGYSPNKPEKTTISDVELSDYYESPEFKQGQPFSLWKSKQQEIGKTSAITTAIELGETIKGGGTVPNAPKIERQAIPSMTTEEKKQLSEFKAKTNNFKMMEAQLTSLDKLIESGKYNKDIIQSFLSDFGKVAPENMMTMFGSKEALIKTYRMDAQLAGTVFEIIKAESGLTVTDTERKIRMEQIFGGLSANTTARREVFQSYLKSTADSLNLEADTIAGFGGVDTAQQWKNYQRMIGTKPSMQSKYDNPKTNQNTPTFNNPLSKSVYDTYKYEPFLVNIKTGERVKFNSKYNPAEFKAFILNPHTNKVERVK